MKLYLTLLMLCMITILGINQHNTNPLTLYDDSIYDQPINISYEEKQQLLSNLDQKGNYFYNLRDNFGWNELGSCGYISLGMLLTYYDSYYNDNFIYDDLDKPTHLPSLSSYNTATSPGSIEIPILNDGSGMSFEDYLNKLELLNSNSLNLNLFRIAQNLGQTDFGTTPTLLKEVLHKYLNDQNLSVLQSIIMVSNDDFGPIIHD